MGQFKKYLSNLEIMIFDHSKKGGKSFSFFMVAQKFIYLLTSRSYYTKYLKASTILLMK